MTYAYDSVFTGALCSVQNANSTTTFDSYDAVGRVTHATQTTAGNVFTTGYSYDLAGGLELLTYPSGRQVKTCPDVAGRPAEVSDNGTGATYVSGVQDAPQGAIRQMTYGKNALTASIGYSADRLQMTSVKATAGSTSLLALGYYYCPGKALSCSSNNGNVLAQTMGADAVSGHAAFSREYIPYMGFTPQVASNTASAASAVAAIYSNNNGTGATYDANSQQRRAKRGGGAKVRAKSGMPPGWNAQRTIVAFVS